MYSIFNFSNAVDTLNIIIKMAGLKTVLSFVEKTIKTNLPT